MIGNDVVDLNLAGKESNWQRKGFLSKIFTKNEQTLIQNSENQEIAVWNLWSRKEAAYKIWNRETGIRKFNPIQFECFDLESETGKVQFKNTIYFTKTEILTDYIHTIAVLNKEIFNNIKFIKKLITIEKKKGIPFYVNENQKIKPVSKSHHGRFESIITIN
jgi:phosphopantetheinyl transferase (holo-ACP synthase)